MHTHCPWCGPAIQTSPPPTTELAGLVEISGVYSATPLPQPHPDHTYNPDQA